MLAFAERSQPQALCLGMAESLDTVFSVYNSLTSRTECDNMKRGDIYRADLDPVIGSEQGGRRPVLIIQNDVGNRHSPTVICAAITSKMNKAKLPTHVELDAAVYHMVKDSVILLEQLRTIDKKRLSDKIGVLSDEIMLRVNEAIKTSLDITT